MHVFCSMEPWRICGGISPYNSTKSSGKWPSKQSQHTYSERFARISSSGVTNNPPYDFVVVIKVRVKYFFSLSSTLQKKKIESSFTKEIRVILAPVIES